MISRKPMKYIVVTGGTLSGLGKGTTISSIGVVLRSIGLRVTSIKIDPYLNVDAGTMSPHEHGEVFVLNDGGEGDLDLGNYERFLDVQLTADHNLTTGKIYKQVIERERRGEFLGKTVQVVPHITDAIQSWIHDVAHRITDNGSTPADICLIEVGGTVGDIESSVYLEALQQFQYKVGEENFCLCQLGYVPAIGGELKTKPTQHSVRILREAGLRPNMIFCRSDINLPDDAKKKISMFAQLSPENIISVHNVPNTFCVPLVLDKQDVANKIMKILRIDPEMILGRSPSVSLKKWERVAFIVAKPARQTKIGIVAKYLEQQDAYLSVLKSLQHAGIESNAMVNIAWINASELEPATKMKSPEKYDHAWAELKSCDGILTPGGFGERGVEGKVLASKYCRTHGKPYLGICLGFQVVVMDLARHELGLENANSEEFDKEARHKVIKFMPEVSTTHLGGTMRLGIRNTLIKDENSLAFKLYDHHHLIGERHRHRYEVNIDYVPSIESKSVAKFTGTDDKMERMEILEIPTYIDEETGKEMKHPFFFAAQYHPEFLSRPMKTSPPFLGLVLASLGELDKRFAENDGKLMAGGCFDELLSSIDFHSDMIDLGF